MPDTYELSGSKADLKRKEYSYYQRYTRQEGERLKKLQRCSDMKLSDYVISNKFDLLLNNAPKPKCKTHHGDKKERPPSFIPLTPLQLNKVKVYPSYIKLGKVWKNYFTVFQLAHEVFIYSIVAHYLLIVRTYF